MTVDSLVEESEHGVFIRALGEETVPLLADVHNLAALVELEGLQLLCSADLSRDLVLHVLVGVRVLQTLILLRKSQLLEGFNLLCDSVVLRSRDGAVLLAMVGLEEGTLQYVLSLTLSQLSLEKNVTLLPITQVKQMANG